MAPPLGPAFYRPLRGAWLAPIGWKKATFLAQLRTRADLGEGVWVAVPSSGARHSKGRLLQGPVVVSESRTAKPGEEGLEDRGRLPILLLAQLPTHSC